MTEWYCIVNPHAGSGKTMPEWTKASAIMRENDLSFVEVMTCHRAHATQLAYEAASSGYRRFIAIGGDGSVHEVLNGIMQYADGSGVPPEDFTLAVIPIGSGNDWIKSTGVPHDTSAIIKMIAGGSFKRQDVVRVETSEGVCYMANVGGVGFDSHVCMTVNRQKAQGMRSRLIYLLALLKTIVSLKKQTVRIEADGKLIHDGEIYSIAFGNGSYSGGGMRQVPLSLLDDGLLDFMIVPRLSLLRIVREMPRLLNGRLYKASCLKMGTCRTVTVTGDDIVEVDGEIRGDLPVTITVTGRQINVLAGRNHH